MPEKQRRDEGIEGFVARLRGVEGGMFRRPGRAKVVHVARAPGRLDVMGGISDYSGGLVLQWPIAEAAYAAAQIDEAGEGGLELVSLPATEGQEARRLTLGATAWAELLDAGYDAARVYFAAEPSRHWAAYVAGVLLVLEKEKGVRPRGTTRVLLRSEVPEGKGVSSSAAVEVASMQACAAALGLTLEGSELAALCQRAENRVAGAPCGIMDQMTTALGREGELLELLCQPAQVRGYARPAKGLGFWGIDSGIRHAVTGSDYVSVRVGAFMGYRILGERVGVRGSLGADGVWRFDEPPWGGYLANIPVEEFESEHASALPTRITGAEFLSRYGGTTDPVTRVDPQRAYAVRGPAAHPVYEAARVARFVRRLGEENEEARVELGRLMYESHASYTACGLGSAGTDRLVELVRELGPGAGLYGAKITGGGSGGTVAVLGRCEAEKAVWEVAQRYQQETGNRVYVFSGSSAGACAVGTVEVWP